MAAASSRRVLASGLLVAANLSLPAAAQQTVEQPVFERAPESRMEVSPLPPIGGNPGTQGAGDPAGETLPQPRFLRVPSAGDEGGQAAGDPGPSSGDWESSPDGRFHRAPQSGGPPALTAPAPVVPIDPPPTDLRAGARLRELDKMTGHTKTFEIGVGETREIDRLRIQLEACRSPEGNDMHGTMAFLKVWDTKYAENEAAFSGWMFAESPALSALDHPRYDLWVISCTTSAVATSDSSE